MDQRVRVNQAGQWLREGVPPVAWVSIELAELSDSCYPVTLHPLLFEYSAIATRGDDVSCISVTPSVVTAL